MAHNKITRKQKDARGGENTAPLIVHGLTCPVWLHEYAKGEWARLVDKLRREGRLHDVDESTIWAYAQACAEYQLATEALESQGRFLTTSTGYKQQHPALAFLKGAQAAMKAYGAQLGIVATNKPRRGGVGGGVGRPQTKEYEDLD